MPEKKVLPKMKPMVLAQHHPAVVAVDPHFFPYRFLPVCGNSRRHGNPDTCVAASICARKRPTGIGGSGLLISRCFLILKGARGRQGVPSPAATDRLTSALGIVELLANPRQAERLEGKEEAHSNNCDAHA